jgi:hypothetical protein
MFSNFLTRSVVLMCGVVAGCAEAIPEGTGDTPDIVEDALGTEATITNTNADGVWVADAIGTSANVDNLFAKASFTGPAGKTRRMGACLLRRYEPPSGGAQTCTTVADCSNAPSTLPTGGFRYCTASAGSTIKRCYFRPGPPTTHCVGTPANGGQPIASGFYNTPGGPEREGAYISYACFEGCTASDPAISSINNLVQKCRDPGRNGECLDK